MYGELGVHLVSKGLAVNLSAHQKSPQGVKKINQTACCLILASGFIALGLISYAIRNRGIGNEIAWVSIFLGSAPSLFHGAFFLALVTAFDPRMKNIEKNALVCLAIITILEIVAFRIWWGEEAGTEFWRGVFDMNDVIAGILGIGLSFQILKRASRKRLRGL